MSSEAWFGFDYFHQGKLDPNHVYTRLHGKYFLLENLWKFRVLAWLYKNFIKLNSFLEGNNVNNSQCIFNFDFFRRKGGYEKVERSGLEEFDKRKGHIIFNELKMGGKDRKFATHIISWSMTHVVNHALHGVVFYPS